MPVPLSPSLPGRPPPARGAGEGVRGSAVLADSVEEPAPLLPGFALVLGVGPDRGGEAVLPLPRPGRVDDDPGVEPRVVRVNGGVERAAPAAPQGLLVRG